MVLRGMFFIRWRDRCYGIPRNALNLSFLLFTPISWRCCIDMYWSLLATGCPVPIAELTTEILGPRYHGTCAGTGCSATFATLPRMNTWSSWNSPAPQPWHCICGWNPPTRWICSTWMSLGCLGIAFRGEKTWEMTEMAAVGCSGCCDQGPDGLAALQESPASTGKDCGWQGTIFLGQRRPARWDLLIFPKEFPSISLVLARHGSLQWRKLVSF